MTEVEGKVEIAVASTVLQGDLLVPAGANGVVVFAHGSGSSRLSPRNRSVASYFRSRSLGTLLFDLLTAEEERIDVYSRQYRFDIPFLAGRLVAVTDWLADSHGTPAGIGYFGASTGAAAALAAAAETPQRIQAIVSRGGRPDLAAAALERVRAPTLLIVGGNDPEVLLLNESALAQLRCEKELVVVPGATHLFAETGTLEAVAAHAAAWFNQHFARTDRTQ
jgi:pimeloyl-ACP methyl ester carboxylesterase